MAEIEPGEQVTPQDEQDEITQLINTPDDELDIMQLLAKAAAIELREVLARDQENE